MVSEFPAFETKDGKTYLYKTITDTLANAIVLFDECELDAAREECRRLTQIRLDKMPRESEKEYSIVNTLPSKDEVAPDIIDEIG